MLSHEENRLLTQVGPDAPMGQLFRRYWIPVLASAELPEPDGAPVSVRILGEDLVAFRDTAGRVGLVDEACPHRCTSLAYGLNAEHGLRCIYHGWKFDVEGRCVDLPSEPKESRFREKIRLKAYPTVEAAGVVWAYLGPEETKPPFPTFWWMTLPLENLAIARVWQECNYAQVIENDLDFVHAAFLHRSYQDRPIAPGLLSDDLGVNPSHPLLRNPPVKQFVQPTRYGQRCVAIGEAEAGGQAIMEIHYIFPFFTYPPRFPEEDGMWHAFVPRDDFSTWSWDVQFSNRGPIDVAAQHARRGLILDSSLRKLRNRDNHYQQDRELMRTGNLSGMRGIATQDHAVTETMGPIVDRTREHLGTSDLPIIGMRKILLDSVREFMRTGRPPYALHQFPLERLYSRGVRTGWDQPWEQASPVPPEFAADESSGLGRRASQ